MCSGSKFLQCENTYSLFSSFTHTCIYDLNKMLLLNDKCTARDSCSCSDTDFENGFCTSESFGAHTSNVHVSSALGRNTKKSFNQIVPSIPVDGLFLYTLHIDTMTVNPRYYFMDYELDALIVDSVKRYLKIAEANVQIYERVDEDSVITLVLTIMIPDTSTIEDIIYVNAFLSQMSTENLFPDAPQEYELSGYRSADKESNANAIVSARNHNIHNMQPSLNKYLFLPLLGGILGCFIGAIVMFRLMLSKDKSLPSRIENSIHVRHRK